jgi:hypothetical protein
MAAERKEACPMEILLFWVIAAVVAGMIGKSKGRSFFPWFAYGFLIWPVAIVHALLLKQAPGTEAGL